MKKLTVLGSTGSIGVNTLEIVKAFPDKFQIIALSAGHNISLLEKQIRIFNPRSVSVRSQEDAERLALRMQGQAVEICHGVEGMIRCATAPESDMVVAAVVGAAGLVPTLAAIKAGKDIALANKETLVMAGDLIMQEVERRNVTLVPVDSEHSAIFQSLSGHRHEDVRHLILTASGGPFREYGLAQFDGITPDDALAHPNWAMGKKISIDSATMMNKGLEIIEARWLFDFPAEKIKVHVHPESIVHSLVEYQDGAVMAQLGIPDMKTPIAYALSWPQRMPLKQPPLDLCELGRLTFSQPDLQRFPCLALAYAALAAGGTMPAVLNAVNEIAVEAFLNGKLTFMGIPRLIETVMSNHQPVEIKTIDKVLQADLWSRKTALELISGGFV